MEGGIVWSMRYAWYRWFGWFLKLRAELHCNHNDKDEGSKRSLNKCESKEATQEGKIQLTY